MEVFDPARRMEKILAGVGGGDMTVACREPGRSRRLRVRHGPARRSSMPLWAGHPWRPARAEDRADFNPD
ncbi:MAG: hypothetical protein ACP5NP_02880 [Acetobacteraceae bacterium]